MLSRKEHNGYAPQKELNKNQKPANTTMKPFDTALIIIDVQEKLIQNISSHKSIVWNIRRMVDASKLLNTKMIATEQNPKRLGSTINILSERFEALAIPKMAFSCAKCKQVIDILSAAQIKNVLLCGIETHICVQQTALDLQEKGFHVYLTVDAIGSRHITDHEIALLRMSASGIKLTTTESVIFEWCESAENTQFSKISQLIKETV